MLILRNYFLKIIIFNLVCSIFVYLQKYLDDMQFLLVSSQQMITTLTRVVQMP